jgi:TonB family protein
MLVTGAIDVAPDGGVYSYTLDRPERIPAPVVDLIKNSVPGWKFQFAEPVNAIQHATMHLRIVAKPTDDQNYVLRISGANFVAAGADASVRVTQTHMRIPRYPAEAIRERVSGTVFLLVRINRQGLIQNMAVEQVNLRVYGSEAEMRHFRSVLGDAVLKVADEWTFKPPTAGKHAADPYWDVRIPVSFDTPAGASDGDAYGKWETYIPGPRASIPWAANRRNSSLDAIPTGSMSQVDQPMELKTALDGV